MTKTKRWEKARTRHKIRELREELAAAPDDFAAMGALGVLLAESECLDRGAVVAAFGLLEHIEDRSDWDARHWRAYGDAAHRLWEHLGAKAPGSLAEKAELGWERAEAGGGATCHDHAMRRGTVKLALGDHGKAAELLHAVADGSGGRGAAVAALRVAGMYQHELHRHDEAVTLLFRLFAAPGGVEGFRSDEIFFLLARCYDDWSSRDGYDDAARARARRVAEGLSGRRSLRRAASPTSTCSRSSTRAGPSPRTACGASGPARPGASGGERRRPTSGSGETSTTSRAGRRRTSLCTKSKF